MSKQVTNPDLTTPVHLLPIKDQWKARRVQITPDGQANSAALNNQPDQVTVQPASGSIISSTNAPVVTLTAASQLGLTNPDPHCGQYLAKYGQLPPQASLRRTLLNNEPRLAYQERFDEVKTVIGWGQRKLAMVVIEFLTLYSRPGDTVVYAGAAPGTNLAFIADLFPQLTFDLYDPRKFDLLLQNYANIRTYQQYFTDETAASYRYDQDGYQREDVLLISDIRTGGNNDNTVQFEEHVWQDMLMQQGWYFIMQPRQAHLKFRLPYQIEEVAVAEQLEYLDGVIFLQPWAKATSGETRLVPNGKLKLWSTKLYEDQMFSHNVIGRVQRYDNPSAFVTTAGPAGPVGKKSGVAGMDHCFDCASETAIFKQYLLRRGSYSEQDLINLSLRLGTMISRGKSNLANYVAVYSKDE